MMTTTLTEEVRPSDHAAVDVESLSAAAWSVRLICFHHAGGGATSFNLWKRGLGSDVEVVAVEIPNRERFATLRDLVDEVNDSAGIDAGRTAHLLRPQLRRHWWHIDWRPCARRRACPNRRH